MSSITDSLAGLGREYSDLVLDQMPGIVWAVDPDLRVAFSRGRGLAALGSSAGSAVGMTLQEYFADDPRGPTQIEAHERALVGERVTLAGEWGGSWFEAQIQPLRSETGDIIGALGIAVDTTERREAEAARARLAESEARFAEILDNTAAAVFVKDLDGRYIFANRACGDVLGITAETMVGKTDEDVLPHDVARRAEAQDARVLETRAPVTSESTVEIAGRRRTFLVDKFPLFGGNDVPYAVCAIATDVSERVKSEEFAAGQKRVLEMIAAGEPLASVLERLCHVIEERTPGMLCSVLLLEERGDALVPGAAPSLPAEFNAAVERVPVAARAGSCGTAAFRGEEVISPDIGTDPLWEDWRDLALAHNLRACWSTPILSSDGDVLGTFAIYYGEPRAPAEEERELVETATHIAGIAIERTRAEEERRKGDERYRELFENANDVIAIVNLHEEVVSVNRAAERLLGYPREKLIRKHLSELLSPEHFALAREQSRRKLSGEAERTTYEVEFLTKDGRKIPVEVSSRVVRRNGEPVGFESICRDLSERRALEERLRQAQRMEAIGQLAGGIAHDFNNLLMAIRGYSEVALASLQNGKGEVRTELEEIKHAAERAASLTGQLLAFGRRQILQPRVVDLNVLVREMEALLKRVIGEDIELTTRFDAELARVKVDPGQMEQAIMNIAVNARDAMPEGGKLEIATADVELNETYADDTWISAAPPDAGRYVRLSISDTGTGIDPAIKPQIFEPFFTTKEPGKGTGLGLSTVHGIVNQSGGHISVETHPARGTTFGIYLPAVSEPAAVDDDETALDTVTGNERILLVEDEEVVRRLLRGALESNGYRVLEASDGIEALEIGARQEQPIDVLVTDLVMPGMSGRQLAERLLERHPEMKVLAVSGYAEERIPEANGAGAFLQKPFSPALLVRKVRDLLDASPTR